MWHTPYQYKHETGNEWVVIVFAGSWPCFDLCAENTRKGFGYIKTISRLSQSCPIPPDWNFFHTTTTGGLFFLIKMTSTTINLLERNGRGQPRCHHPNPPGRSFWLGLHKSVVPLAPPDASRVRPTIWEAQEYIMQTMKTERVCSRSEETSGLLRQVGVKIRNQSTKAQVVATVE